MTLREELNLELAWTRHKKDLADMAFCDHPFEAQIIDRNRDGWLDNLRNRLKDYSPSRADTVNIPKKGFHLRPGSVLTPEDATVFQALLLKDIDEITRSLLWSAQKERFSYILKKNQTTAKWFVNEYTGWTNFREHSLANIEEGYDWVVFADISAYFENISIARLVSDLRALGMPPETRSLLSTCLNRWAEPKSRGIPQGYRCSFILSEVYLNSVDKRLKNKGLRFCRYVDDIRIFCKSQTDAVSALHLLTVLLREKELNLQTSKSFIRQGGAAKEKIDSVTGTINGLQEKLLVELSGLLDYDIEYATPAYIEQSLASRGQTEVELETIRWAFDEHIVEHSPNFDKTLFHYCINRLGATDDSHAVDFCINVILERPEEFIHVLAYFSKLKRHKTQIAENLIDTLSRVGHSLDRHYFLLLRWISNEQLDSDQIIELCRKIAFSADVDVYSKHYAWAILGENGDLADLDAIEAEYGRAERELSKASVMCAIKNMVVDRRNSIYARAQNDGLLVQYAINMSR